MTGGVRWNTHDCLSWTNVFTDLPFVNPRGWRRGLGQGMTPGVAERTLTAYLAARGFTAELLEELERSSSPPRILQVSDRLVITEGEPREAAWAQNTWRDCLRLPFSSVAEAARLLRERQRNWAKFTTRFHRRGELIQARLPVLSSRPLRFLDPLPASPMGSWTLLDQHTMLAAPSCSSPFPHGELDFVEDREAPPSRAYLKLWELFTVYGVRPRAGESCIDLGSAPGGWSWVLATLGCSVTSVDKAPLDPRVAGLRGVRELRESAFALDPRGMKADWLFSDIICYPARLYGLVTAWLDAGACRNVVCSVKFQGRTDFDALRAFASIAGSRLVHLSHNRHELTFFLLGGSEPSR